MTVKQFFKSTSFKCIAALLSILLVCGVFLTVMYGLLEVSAGEKLQRSIAKVYSGMEVTVYGLDDDGNEVEIDSKVSNPKSFVSQPVTIDNAEISQAYKIVYTQNGQQVVNYLVTSTGFGGYDNGTVTCSVAVIVDNNKVSGIYKVSIQSNVGQSFIGRVGENALNEFADIYSDDIYYTQDMITGATTVKTKTAICNSVNGALAYVEQVILGNAVVNKFEGFYDPAAMINTVRSDYAVDGGTVTYTLVTKGYGMTDAFTLNVKVSAVSGTAAIDSFEIVTNGSTANYEEKMNAKILDGTLFAGKTLSDITAMLDTNWNYPGDLKTGATASNSDYNCMYACAFALYNYSLCLGGNA